MTPLGKRATSLPRSNILGAPPCRLAGSAKARRAPAELAGQRHGPLAGRNLTTWWHYGCFFGGAAFLAGAAAAGLGGMGLMDGVGGGGVPGP